MLTNKAADGKTRGALGVALKSRCQSFELGDLKPNIYIYHIYIDSLN